MSASNTVKLRLITPTNRPQSHNLAWLVWGVSAVFVLFQFFLQLASGVMVGGLMHSFALSTFGGGILASTYYYIYVTLQIPAGMLVDRYGPRRLLTLGAVVCTLGTLIFGYSANLWVAGFGRMLMGAGASFAFVGSLNLISRWFPVERFAMMTAIAETVGMVGSLLGGFFLADLIHHVGWREGMIGAGVLGFVISVMLWTIVRDKPQQETSITDDIPVNQTSVWQNLAVLAKNQYAWINSLYSGLMFAIVTVFVALWAVPFMRVAHHLSLIGASSVCDLVFVGVAIGGPIMGWLDGRFVYRRVLMSCNALLSGLLLIAIIYLPSLPLIIVGVLMLVLGITASSYVLNFAVANEIVPPQMRSTSVGFVNTLSVGTAPILQPLIGLLLALFAGHAAHNLCQYALHDYQLALAVMPILAFIAAGLGCFIPQRTQ